MNSGMVSRTEQDKIFQVSPAAVRPADDMMGITPFERLPAAGNDTPPIPHSQGLALHAGRQTPGPPDVQDLT
jgi:hypothetical protein